jgi:hypothetical protein
VAELNECGCKDRGPKFRTKGWKESCEMDEDLDKERPSRIQEQLRNIY